MVLDGEVVALDEQGRPSFERMQQRMHLASDSAVRRRMRDLPVTYVIFDLLYLDGHYTLPAALRGAPRACSSGSSSRAPSWRTPAYHRGEGSALLAATRQMGVEGVVAKRLDGPYEPGRRSSGWIKVKNVHTQDVVIGGWTPGEGGRRKSLGALAVGVMEDGELRYSGKVGTGFTESTLATLQRELEPLRARRLSVLRPPAAEGHRVRRAAPRGRGGVPRMDARGDPPRTLLQGPSLRQGPARLHP